MNNNKELIEIINPFTDNSENLLLNLLQDENSTFDFNTVGVYGDKKRTLFIDILDRILPKIAQDQRNLMIDLMVKKGLNLNQKPKDNSEDIPKNQRSSEYQRPSELFEESSNPLHWMMQNPGISDNFLKLLLEKEANPNIKNVIGENCLHVILKHPLFEIVPSIYQSILRLLIEFGAHINVPNVSGETPLLNAIKYTPTLFQNLEIVVNQSTKKNFDPKFYRDMKTLISANDNDNRSALNYSIDCEDLKAFRLLMSKGADISRRGESPLMRAISRGKVKFIVPLIEESTDVNVKDENNQTALWRLSSNCRNFRNIYDVRDYEISGIINQLLDKGADPTIKGRLNDREPFTTPLEVFARDGLLYEKLIDGATEEELTNSLKYFITHLTERYSSLDVRGMELLLDMELIQ